MAHTVTIAGQVIQEYRCGTVIVGSGAAGMNCAKKLYEYQMQKQIESPQERIAIVTAGLPLGASRMSGSDKQTYYKLGTSPEQPDCAVSFAQSLTAGGCCHGDLALVEAIGSLRGFYNLVEAGVPFPHDRRGSYVGYKTDHDPYERATSAGPKTSRFMSESLERVVRRYGVPIYDGREAVEFIVSGEGRDRRIVGLLVMNRRQVTEASYALEVFWAENFVLAAGGPGGLYHNSVYPLGQTGMHGIAFKAGLAGENLTESQFGLASTRFRWNVSGSYMQVIPRIFSTDAHGGDKREFLTDYFSSMSRMATAIFLKGYQWPFDPDRIRGQQSSLVDLAVYNETRKGRRVFLDFIHNPIGGESMASFDLSELESEALEYLRATGAMQLLPINRLEHLNRPAIDIYQEHHIDLYTEPLEIAVCAQHNNGGFGVDIWWQSNIPHTFVVGEMAGTHGVKRPGGSALNAGQVGAQRAAEYIAHTSGDRVSLLSADDSSLRKLVSQAVLRIERLGRKQKGLQISETLTDIQQRMSCTAGHIRQSARVRQALNDAVAVYQRICQEGFRLDNPSDRIQAVQVAHLALASIAYLKSIEVLLGAGGGSRGSYLVLKSGNLESDHPITDQSQWLPENKDLRKKIVRTLMTEQMPDLFSCEFIGLRALPENSQAFELTWADFRQGKIFE